MITLRFFDNHNLLDNASPKLYNLRVPCSNSWYFTSYICCAFLVAITWQILSWTTIQTTSHHNNHAKHPFRHTHIFTNNLNNLFLINNHVSEADFMHEDSHFILSRQPLGKYERCSLNPNWEGGGEGAHFGSPLYPVLCGKKGFVGANSKGCTSPITSRHLIWNFFVCKTLL